MKITTYADPHICTYASIMRSRGEKYSVRLELCIKSLNWVEQIASQYGCDAILSLGDTYDKSELTAEELTATGEIKWSNIKHWFLIGNHELSRSDRTFSSSHLFSLIPNAEIIDTPRTLHLNNIDLCFLPYILEQDRQPISYYFPQITDKIIFSHNDISGIQMGQFISKSGFDINDIENNCRLFINGHLHNSTFVSDKIFNLGNLVGQNFSEDATIYPHQICIIDTDKNTFELIDNPYSLNFYKIDLTENPNGLNKVIKNNSVLSVKVSENDFNSVRDIINNMTNVLESRIIVNRDINKIEIENDAKKIELNSVDHLKMFQDFVLTSIGNSNIILNELSLITQ